MSMGRNIFGEDIGQLPETVIKDIEAIFPRSEERVGIAKSMMWFNHNPSQEEVEEIAQQHDRSISTVTRVLHKLKEEELFTTELGSIPLYRAVQKIGAKREKHNEVNNNKAQAGEQPPEQAVAVPDAEFRQSEVDSMHVDGDPTQSMENEVHS